MQKITEKNREFQIWAMVKNEPYETLGLSSNNLEFLEERIEEIRVEPKYVQELCPDTDISIFDSFEILEN